MTNLLPTSAALHTIWVRHHNGLAKQLQVNAICKFEKFFKEINPFWDDERLYQETRQILIAQLQHITYNEFLPIILGKDRLRNAGLQLQAYSFNSDYNIVSFYCILNCFFLRTLIRVY